MRPLWLPSRRLIIPEQPRVQLLHQQQQRMNMAVACCCQPTTPFSCDQDVHPCAQVVGYAGSFFGDVKFWSAGAMNCSDAQFADVGNPYWDGVLDNYTFVPANGWTWQMTPSAGPGGNWWYPTITPAGRVARFVQGTGTLLGCVMKDGSTTEGYYWFKVQMQDGGGAVRDFAAYWFKEGGADKQGVYTYTPALPAGLASWPQGAPTDLDAGCYAPIPPTLEIANC